VSKTGGSTNTSAGLPDAAVPSLTPSAFAVAVGARLRAVRHQTGLSLLAVEKLSNHEFGKSALGAYECGKRVITVPRLLRLALLYNVPVEHLLPPGDYPDPQDAGTGPSRPAGSVHPRRVGIDLVRLKEASGPERQVLWPIINMIQLRRQDFNGRMITIREGDLRTIAYIYGITPDAMERRLDDLGVLVAS